METSFVRQTIVQVWREKYKTTSQNMALVKWYKTNFQFIAGLQADWIKLLRRYWVSSTAEELKTTRTLYAMDLKFRTLAWSIVCGPTGSENTRFVSKLMKHPEEMFDEVPTALYIVMGSGGMNLIGCHKGRIA